MRDDLDDIKKDPTGDDESSSDSFLVFTKILLFKINLNL